MQNRGMTLIDQSERAVYPSCAIKHFSVSTTIIKPPIAKMSFSQKVAKSLIAKSLKLNKLLTTNSVLHARNCLEKRARHFL